MQGRAELRHALASPVSGSSSRMLWGHFLTWHAGHLAQRPRTQPHTSHLDTPVTKYWVITIPSTTVNTWDAEIEYSFTISRLYQDYFLKNMFRYTSWISVFNNQNIGNRGWGFLHGFPEKTWFLTLFTTLTLLMAFYWNLIRQYSCKRSNKRVSSYVFSE